MEKLSKNVFISYTSNESNLHCQKESLEHFRKQLEKMDYWGCIKTRIIFNEKHWNYSLQMIWEDKNKFDKLRQSTKSIKEEVKYQSLFKINARISIGLRRIEKLYLWSYSRILSSLYKVGG